MPATRVDIPGHRLVLRDGGVIVFRVMNRSTLAGVATEENVSGILLRLGTEPMHADDLADRFAPLPTELIAHRLKRPAEWETGSDTPWSLGHRRSRPK